MPLIPLKSLFKSLLPEWLVEKLCYVGTSTWPSCVSGAWLTTAEHPDNVVQASDLGSAVRLLEQAKTQVWRELGVPNN